MESLHYYNNTASKNFTHFFIVNFKQAETVKGILDSAQHSESDGSSATPVPVYSPFLWLQGGKLSKNQTKYQNIPVDYGSIENSEQKVRSMADLSEQMYYLWKSDTMTDTSLRLRFLVCRQIELAISGIVKHHDIGRYN